MPRSNGCLTDFISGTKSAAAKEPDDGFVAPVVYYVFDLLYHDGKSLLDVPLEQRKRLLRSVMQEHESVRRSYLGY